MSVSLKVKVLRYVAEQGVVTVEDVQRYFVSNYSANTMRVALYKSGLRHIKFGNIQYGLWCIKLQEQLDLLKTYFGDLPDLLLEEIHLHIVPHALGMNRIRTILEKNSQLNIVEWWSERHLRSLPTGMRDGFGFNKIPDAIFWRVRKDGTRQKFFLEYERSQKNRTRYKEIFQFYAQRKDVLNQNVLYICDSEAIKNELIQTEQILVKAGKLESTGVYFQFVTLKDLCSDYLPSK